MKKELQPICTEEFNCKRKCKLDIGRVRNKLRKNIVRTGKRRNDSNKHEMYTYGRGTCYAFFIKNFAHFCEVTEVYSILFCRGFL